MSDWYIDKDFGAMQNTSEFDGADIPVFQNRTGHPVKIDSAYLAGVVSADASNYYVLTLKDDAGNTIVSKSLANVALTASGSTSMGTVTTAYQVIDDGNTVYMNFTKAGNGASLNFLNLRLGGEILRGG